MQTETGSARRWCQLASARRARGLALSTLGPNEARILFDVAAAITSGAVALLLATIAAVAGPGLPPWAVVVLEAVVFLGGNTALGLYSRHRASGWSRGTSRTSRC